MKVFVKTLKGTNFSVEVQPEDTVADVKRNIETTQGKMVYPAEQQMLIHQGKILKDSTTLDENKIAADSFLVIMLTKPKDTSAGASTANTAPSFQAPLAPVAANPSTPAPATPQQPAATLAPVPASEPTPAATATASPPVVAS